jgi:heme-degrading monooxygenase HmoA
MFAQNEILVFTPGRKQEGLDRLAWIHGLMAPQPGFKEALVAKYLGDASRHTIMRFWEDETVFQAFRATPDGSYGRNRPEGLYVNEPVVTPLVSYGEAAGSASGDFLIKVQHDLQPGAWDAFLEQQKQMLNMGASMPGLVWVRQFRGKDKDSAVIVARFSSRDVFESMVESPLYAEGMKSMPEGVATVRLECFEVVKDVAPKK